MHLIGEGLVQIVATDQLDDVALVFVALRDRLEHNQSGRQPNLKSEIATSKSMSSIAGEDEGSVSIR